MIGGTGYLGYFAVDELTNLNHEVTVIGLPPAPSKDFFNNKKVDVRLVNISDLTEQELEALFSGFDILIFAGGADGRNSFPTPAINGFRKENVDATVRLIRTASKSKIKKVIILGSYYTAIERMFPELNILEDNPYILSRFEQNAGAFENAGKEMDVIILELPYIFGAAPGKGTLWGFYIKHVLEKEEVFVPSGGTACVTARQVGQAIAGACNSHIKSHLRIPIADSNHSYKSIYGMFCNALKLERSLKIKSLETSLQDAKKQQDMIRNAGIQGAYDPVSMVYLQNNKLHLDPAIGMDMLGYSKANMDEAIKETVEATLKYSPEFAKKD